VQTATLYRAVPVRRLPAAAREAMQARTLDAVMLFSPRTAQIFVSCVNEGGLRACCHAIFACCISEAAGKALKSLQLADIRWPSRPDQACMLALLE
jgi:uroporphyrinogen-III synthase